MSVVSISLTVIFEYVYCCLPLCGGDCVHLCVYGIHNVYTLCVHRYLLKQEGRAGVEEEWL